jgi:hypothetical protein
VAVRAVAFMARSWWGGRPHRRVSYDAWWPDGRLENGVSLASVLQLRHPADIADAETAVHDRCPEIGPGEWCDRWGRVVDGPVVGSTGAGSPRRPQSQRRPRSQRREFGVPRYDPTKKPSRTGRLVAGLVALVVGVVLLVATSGDGALALVGLVCLVPSVGLLAGLVPRERRWW